tara:strand:- start:298 stop:840 length:543 start_codon:yes stop_codon:yes gene_type:complete
MYPSNELLTPNTTKSEYLFIDTRQTTDIGNKVTFENEVKMKFRIKFNETASVASGQLAHALSPGVVYKNIKSVELCGLSFSNNFIADLSDIQYLVIDIEELSGRVHSNNQFAHGTFAILYLEDLKAYHKGADFFEKIKTFNPPLSSLSSLNVQIFTPDNQLLTIPTNGSITMMFKIITVV